MKKEEILKFYNNFRIYIFPAVVAIASLFLIVFAIYPQTIKLIDNQQSAEGLVSKSKFMENKVSALEGFDEEDLAQKVRLALASLPADKDFGNILGLLQQLITESGFDVISISLGNTGGRIGSTESYELRLEIQGEKSGLSTLISNIENSPRLIRLNSITTSSNQASQKMDVSLAVGALYSKVPQSFGSADSPLPQITQQDEELISKLSGVGSITTPGSTDFSPRGKPNPFE